jgi:hypothetical protein
MPIKNLTAGNYGGYASIESWIKFQYEPRKKQLEETVNSYKAKVKDGKATSTDKAYLAGDSAELNSLNKQYKMYTKDGTRLKS